MRAQKDSRIMIAASSRQRGVSMLEALIAIVILAFGMLGVAGLNLVSLRTTQESSYRTVASQAALELTDKLRASWGDDGTAVKAFVQTATAPIPTGTSLATKCAGATVCTAAEALTYEITSWAKSLTDMSIADAETRGKVGRLPGASAIVCYDSTPSDGTPAAPSCDAVAGAPMVIKIWWRERQKNSVDAGAAALFATSFQP